MPIIEPESRAAYQDGPIVRMDGFLKEFLCFLKIRIAQRSYAVLKSKDKAEE
jgi:hypothetical protein